VKVEEKAESAKQDIAPIAADAGDRIKISPRAKKLAEKTGVDYRYALPTGPNGRIIEQDVITLKESGYVMTGAARDEFMKAGVGQIPQGTGLGGRITTGDLSAVPANVDAVQGKQTPQPLYEEVKLTNIRKVIAKAMHHSITSTCQLTLNASFDATDILDFRKKLKEGKDRLGLENITLNDIILYAVSRTLMNHKDLNAHFLDDKMLYFRNVNLGVAVDTERGLMVPNIFNANLKSLNAISKETKKLVKDCQSGTINPDVLKGGSFTVTNLGTLDVESFTPVLNPPQTGILGVNTIVQKAREVDGEYEFYPAMGLSLTFDHRALDGAPAARFLQELKKNLENFSIMLVK
jgi:pyruvate dehydrogenase E2 component (dihydrolipoamide acetyltransferase)